MSRRPATITQADVARESRDEWFVYLIRAGEFVKIGRSKRWKARMAHMQIASPHTVAPLLVLVGDAKFERELHNRFRADHYRGEWFHMSPTISKFIKDNLKDCVAKSETVDLRKPAPEIIL